MKWNTTKLDRAKLRAENRSWPKQLIEVARSKWPFEQKNLNRVFRSRDFLVQIFAEPKAWRLSVNRTEPWPSGEWADGISWDELMELKRQCGFGDVVAYEIYPPDKDVVNVANIRHLWIPVGAARDDIEALMPRWKNERTNKQ